MRCFPLTVASFSDHTSCDAKHDDETNDVAAVVLDETFELLDFLLHRVPDVLFTFRLHVNSWRFNA